MSVVTRSEVMVKLRSRYRNAGLKYRGKLIDQAVELFGYHRKAAIRALGWRARPALPRTGRPPKYDRVALQPALKAIWLASQQPCGKRLVAMMADWVPAYEAYHRSLSEPLKEQLLTMSSATLDRMLGPLRARHAGQSIPTRPGAMLRQEIPIRGGAWQESQAGWQEADTVSLSGGSAAGEVIWMLDSTDICTTWVEMRAMFGRGQHAAVEQLAAIERLLPFPWLGLDSDNGGEFINRHVLRWCQQKRAEPIYYTRSRPYRSNDNAHIEQKNWTHVRQFQNLFSASMKLESRSRTEEGRERRAYAKAVTPFERVLASPQVTEEKKTELKALKARLNPFALEAAIQKKLRTIHRLRRALE